MLCRTPRGDMKSTVSSQPEVSISELAYHKNLSPPRLIGLAPPLHYLSSSFSLCRGVAVPQEWIKSMTNITRP
ncbi:hypothetical protein AOLI_G00170990 [Acnodon oligacanthus]